VRPQLAQLVGLTETGSVEGARLHRPGSVDDDGGVPEGAQQRHAVRELPHTGGHDAARTNHAAHLRDTPPGIAHPGHDELRQGCVELAVLERQLLSASDTHIRAGYPPGARVHPGREGSTAATDPAPRPAASAWANAPVPQPTSSARCPRSTPATVINAAAHAGL
jgi:hypothetical protein